MVLFTDPSWWLMDLALFGFIALAVMFFCVSKRQLHPTFKHQALILAILWPLVIFWHLHLSGYGATGYLGFMGTLDYLKQIPFYNWYNMNPYGSQAGYDTMYLMHGIAGGLFFGTFDLFFSELSLGWCFFLSFAAATIIQVVWEMTEVMEGLVRCNSTIFGTIQAACNEMALRIQHQCYTTGAALAVMIILAIIFYLKDRSQ
jgi:hypothetical protein